MPTYSGIRPTDKVPAGTKLRVTWGRDAFARVSFFPPSAVAAATSIQEIGPTRGFYVVSAPAVSPGDQTFVLDVRSQTHFTGTMATLAGQLDAASGFDVTAVRVVPVTERSDTAAAERADLQAGAEKKADDARPDPLGAVGKELRRLLMWGAIGAGALLVLTNLGAIKAVGRAVKRGVK